MKETIFIRLCTIVLCACSLLINNANGQVIRKIAHPSSVGYITSYADSPPIIYNNKLYFNYSDTRFINVNLGEFDAQRINIINAPTQNSSLKYPLIFNNKLFYIYGDGGNFPNAGELMQYDGERLITYPNPDDIPAIGVPMVYDSKIYVYNRNSDDVNGNQKGLSVFDGKQISIDTLVNKNGSYNNYQILTAFNNQLVFVDNGKLASFDGSATNRFDTPDGFDRLQLNRPGFPVLLDNNLFVNYTNTSTSISNLAKFDGTKVTVVPNRKITDSYYGHPFTFQDQLYFRYHSPDYQNDQLARYNGDSIEVIHSPDVGQFSNMDYIEASYHNELYIIYKNSNGINFLAKCDGDSLKIISNPDAGTGFSGSLFVFGDKIFSSYVTSAGISKIITYNGSNFEFIASEDDSDLSFLTPIVYAGKLYFTSTGNLVYLDITTLPISLIQFTGKQKDNAALLSWQTSSSRNTSQYIVQRSKDGINFVDIDSVKGTGNSNSIIDYTYADNSFTNLGSSKLYYRLKQEDHDGKWQFSNIIVLIIKGSADVFTVYPSPARDLINIDIPHSFSTPAQIVLYDMNGKNVARNFIEPGNLHQQINISNMKNGNYHIVIVADNKKVLVRTVTISH